MKKLRIGLLTCASLLIVSILLIKGFTGHAAHAAPASNTCGSWSIIPSPNVKGQSFNGLSGVAALSSSDAWAVGYYIGEYNNVYKTLTEHWNGSQWSIVPSPDVGNSTYDVLDAVTEISATNAWAVGAYLNAKKHVYFPLIEQWNGSSWHIVANPGPGSAGTELLAVTAISANDIWAVGAYSNHVGKTLVEHWNGSAWSVVPSPSKFFSVLNSVSALASNDVWAAGFYMNRQKAEDQTFIAHWNGSQWSIVSSPNVGNGSILTGVTAISSSDVWAVGTSNYASRQVSHTLIEQWNGTSWNVVTSPNAGAYSNHLDGITTVSANAIWAVGNYDKTGHEHWQGLIEQWNGSSWSVVPSPVPPHYGYNDLDAVTAIPGTSQTWAVGAHFPPSKTMGHTLTEYYC